MSYLYNLVDRRKIKLKSYMRVCRRCNEIFKTPAKKGKICDKCYKGTGGNRDKK